MPDRRPLLYLARQYPMPVSSSARLRTFNWILHLSRRFDVTLVAPVWKPLTETDLEALGGRCKRLIVPVPSVCGGPVRRAVMTLAAEAHYLASGLPPERFHLQNGRVREAVELELRNQRFDVAFAERWTWGELFLDAAPFTVLDAGELQASRHSLALVQSRYPLRRLLRRRLQGRYEVAEAAVLSRATLVLVNDAASRRAVLRASGGSARAIVLPAGLDTSHFRSRSGPVDPRNVVFFGSLASPTQRDALRHLHADL
ncbi:MAG: hypothetical protein ACE5G2_13715, partial [Candidatus Krumholzibacteriia bacterium]